MAEIDRPEAVAEAILRFLDSWVRAPFRKCPPRSKLPLEFKD